jgi:hypothetical protein
VRLLSSARTWKSYKAKILTAGFKPPIKIKNMANLKILA